MRKAETVYPDRLPRPDELQPSYNLSAVFDECHNYIYANEGILKDRIFREMVNLIIMKLRDEQNSAQKVLFGITSGEYVPLAS